MQIHELNNFTGTLGSGAYLAIDDGTDTGKISSQGLLAATEARIDNIIAGPAPSAEEIVDARLGADGVTYPSLGDAIRDQFTDVKSALTNLQDDTWDSDDVLTTTGTSGARIKLNGSQLQVLSSSAYDVSSLTDCDGYSYFSLDIDCVPNSGFSTLAVVYLSNNSISYANMLGYLEAAKANVRFKMPSGTKYIVLTTPTGAHPTITLYKSKIPIIEVDILNAENRLDSAENRLTNIENELAISEDIVTTLHLAECRYKVEDGVLTMPASSIYDLINLTNIEGADYISFDYTLNPSPGYGHAPVCFFSAEQETSANLVDYMTSVSADYKYSIPSGAKYVGLVAPTGTLPTITIYRKRLDVMEESLDSLVDALPRATIARADSLSASESISATVGNLKKNTVLGFSTNITTFGSLQVGQGRTTNAETGYLIIDPTTVKVYSYYGSASHIEGTYTHGLTIADYLDICIEESNSEIGYAKITITSNGQTYTINRVRWMGCNKTVYADAISGSYTNCLLSFYCADYTKDYWLFGDSYFDHWVTKSIENGYNNFLCDGFSGRKSDDAYASLERNLLHGKPNAIVWCIGMNNGDSGAVNSSWNTYYTKLKNLCAEKGINLILSTIPNVPTVDNSYKNAIIRSSGYRYVDLAKAVGSDISTSWYTGLLSSDQVHPSSLGDEMIARFMESALPDITK